MPMVSFTFWRTASTRRLARGAKCSSLCRNNIHNETNSSRMGRMRTFLGTIAATTLLALSILRAGDQGIEARLIDDDQAERVRAATGHLEHGVGDFFL